MSNPVHIQSFLDDLSPVLNIVDQVLNDWQGDGCLQFPTLLGTISVKLNWNDKTAREYDAIIRQYVRKHPEWYVTRGAHGGIMKASEKQKKEASLEAKKKAREEIKAALEAKANAVQQAAIASISEDDDSFEDNTNI